MHVELAATVHGTAPTLYDDDGRHFLQQDESGTALPPSATARISHGTRSSLTSSPQSP